MSVDVSAVVVGVADDVGAVVVGVSVDIGAVVVGVQDVGAKLVRPWMSCSWCD